MFFFGQPRQDETCRHESLTCEVASLTAQRSQSQQLIRDLEDENEALRRAERQGRQELDRQESHAGSKSYISS